jgi:ubiquinone/menaquinone biosynthesis C-methylase UbiE
MGLLQNELFLDGRGSSFKMTLKSEDIEGIYSGKVARSYDLRISHFFGRYKKLVFAESALKKGDKVLVFCCGTGLDFPHILKKIGKEGEIVGVDFSSEMLKIAKEKIRKNNWENIELINADITKLNNKIDKKFDVGVCTLGMSIIPEFKSGFYNLLSYMKKQGEIIVGDMQLSSGWFARLNPITIFFSRKYGGSYEGHQNTIELCNVMKKELTGVKKREFFFKSYFYCTGKTK